MIAKDLPRYGKHLFVAKVSRRQCTSLVHMSSLAHTLTHHTARGHAR